LLLDVIIVINVMNKLTGLGAEPLVLQQSPCLSLPNLRSQGADTALHCSQS